MTNVVENLQKNHQSFAYTTSLLLNYFLYWSKSEILTWFELFGVREEFRVVMGGPGGHLNNGAFLDVHPVHHAVLRAQPDKMCLF